MLKQNAATTHAHMLVLAQCLMKNQNVLTEGGAIFENTYGCAKQYLCATTLRLISVFCAKTIIFVDNFIGAPRYGKDLLVGITEFEKQHLKRKIK